ncbi:MAG: HD domain-containing protein [Paenibacillaceae bacterium]
MTEYVERLKQQIDFLMEIDKLKLILRRTLVTDKSRFENTAEHSWHLAMFAMMLCEHANEPDLNVMRVIRMVLIHDIVEIDAGDTFIYDKVGQENKAEREQAAALRIFGILPEDQQEEIRQLWDEFEGRETSEALFAAALDRLHPLLHNYYTEGAAWKQHGITSSQVMERNAHIAEGSEILWEFAEELIRSSVAKGYLAP